MKLRPKESRPVIPKAAEMVRPVEEKTRPWFDPVGDFDPEMKEQILRRVESKYFSFTDAGLEYVIALFPNEVKPFLLSNIDSYIDDFINNPGKDGYTVLWRDVVKAALRVKLAFPEKVNSIHMPDYIQRLSVEFTNSGPEGKNDDLFRFWRIFVLGVSDNKSWEWYVVENQIKLLDREEIAIKAKRLAQARILFPEKDFSSYITTGLKQDILVRLAELESSNSQYGGNFWSQYAELAWAATILAAEEVGISPEGKIFYKMPGPKLPAGSNLPERLLA